MIRLTDSGFEVEVNGKVHKAATMKEAASILKGAK